MTILRIEKLRTRSYHINRTPSRVDWDHCTIRLARTLKNELITVVRSKTNKNSRYMGNKPVELRFMLGFDVSRVSEPRIESYTARENHPDTEKREGPKGGFT